jgi:uncharacterized RDD family membrane protein YckC
MNPPNDTFCPMCGATITVIDRKCQSCGEDLSGAGGSTINDAADLPNSEPAVSIGGTILPRHLAAAFDNVVAIVLAVVASAIIPEDLPMFRMAFVIGVYLTYYLLFERLFAATPGKLLTGLVVVQFNGRACTSRQLIIRTLFRIVEVNPVLLGGLPAAARIVMSKHRQRFGDRLAGTIVVPRRRMKKRNAALVAG